MVNSYLLSRTDIFFISSRKMSHTFYIYLECALDLLPGVKNGR